jgi:hypothetical protein
MFGSDFFKQFGIQPFPMQGMDHQGGMFGENTPRPEHEFDPFKPEQPAPAAGLPQVPQPPAVGAPSPLGGGVLSPGAATPTPPRMNDPGQAPAAGIDSPFGRRL